MLPKTVSSYDWHEACMGLLWIILAKYQKLTDRCNLSESGERIIGSISLSDSDDMFSKSTFNASASASPHKIRKDSICVE